jgi:hypothetical protein
MADSATFEWVCGELERLTTFSQIEARGTVRIALKKGGLTAATATPAQTQVVIKRVLPDELRRRGCEGGQMVCDELATRFKDRGFEDKGRADKPEDIFARLGS